MASPGQLLLTADAVGFWQNRVFRCDPTPHVDVQADHPDHSVQPTAPVNYVIARKHVNHYFIIILTCAAINIKCLTVRCSLRKNSTTTTC